MEQNDKKIIKLMAGPEEQLPTKSEEKEQESLRSNTPISMHLEDLEEEEALIFHYTFRFEMVTTDIDIAFPTLTENYPNENFESESYQRYDIHKYLSDQVNRKEFFIANNQWGIEFANYKKDEPIRMREAIITKFDKDKDINVVYHVKCIKDVNMELGYTKGLLTVETSNVQEFFKCIINVPDLFFCGVCEHYIFDEIQYYDDAQFENAKKYWPKCDNFIMTYGDDDNYVNLMANKCICYVSYFSDEPPKKKVCRRLNFDE